MSQRNVGTKTLLRRCVFLGVGNTVLQRETLLYSAGKLIRQKLLNRSGASAVQSVVFCSSEPGRWNESGANPKSCETRVITRVLAHACAAPIAAQQD
jgi:hypothetical protein